MLLMSRTLYSDNAVISDISTQIADFKAGSYVFSGHVAAEDFLYVGSDFPFNHRYFEVVTVNTNPANLKIELWDGDEWKEAEDIIDQTSLAGVPLSQKGFVSFRPDEDQSWSRDDTDDDGGGDKITGLETVKINGLYWARLSWDADISDGTEIKFIGNRFSFDDDILDHYPILMTSEALEQFETSKTTWDNQHALAARAIIKDLKRNNIVRSGNQILEWSLFRDAAVHKVAEIAYNGYGKDFVEQKKEAHKEYKMELNRSLQILDRNMDAAPDVSERVRRQGFATR